MPQPTRNALINWGNGATEGEYLAADVLIIEDYKSVDPSHPQGGPDRKKDLKCCKAGLVFIGACYFPPDSTQKKFADLKKKFSGDVQGVKKHKADGFLFLTNMKVSLGERKALEKIAKKAGAVCSIYHLERLRGILDGPLGMAAREKYLGIQMTKTQQTAHLRATKVQAVASMDQQIKRAKQVVKQMKEEKKDFLSQLKKAMLQGAKSGRKVKRKKGAKKII